MKMKALALALLTSFSGMAAASTPVELMIPAEEVFLMNGFDSNDSVEVMIYGNLPNLCHKSPTTNVRVVGDKIKITLTALHYEPSNPFCAQVLVPFLETVNVGLLAKGDYKVVINEGTEVQSVGAMHISQATTTTQDNFIYAKVETIEKNENAGTITLVGTNPSDCWVLDEIKWEPNGKNGFAVLPIMKQVKETCTDSPVDFRYTTKVPTDLEHLHVFLIHARSLAGKSVNTLYRNL